MAAYKKQAKIKKTVPEVSLKQRVEMKEGKVSKARTVLGMMTAEFVRWEGKCLLTKRQQRNIRLLKLQAPQKIN